MDFNLSLLDNVETTKAAAARVSKFGGPKVKPRSRPQSKQSEGVGSAQAAIVPSEQPQARQQAPSSPSRSTGLQPTQPPSVIGRQQPPLDRRDLVEGQPPSSTVPEPRNTHAEPLPETAPTNRLSEQPPQSDPPSSSQGARPAASTRARTKADARRDMKPDASVGANVQADRAAGEPSSGMAGALVVATQAGEQTEGASPDKQLVPATGRKRKGAGGGRYAKRRQLAETELDTSTASLKQIILWADAREKVKLAEERKKKAEEGAAAEAAGGGAASTALALPPAPRPAPGGGSMAPQVQIVDGRLVINEQSLTVQAQPAQEYRRVVEDGAQRLNSASYSARTPSARWSSQETEKFYQGLRTFGTNFGLIAELLEGRTRRQVKSKFTRESKEQPLKVDEAMRGGHACSTEAYKSVLSIIKQKNGTEEEEEPEPAAPTLALEAPAPEAATAAGEEDSTQTAAPMQICEPAAPAADPPQSPTRQPRRGRSATTGPTAPAAAESIPVEATVSGAAVGSGGGPAAEREATGDAAESPEAEPEAVQQGGRGRRGGPMAKPRARQTRAAAAAAGKTQEVAPAPVGRSRVEELAAAMGVMQEDMEGVY